MKKILILLLIVGILYIGYEYFLPEGEHGPEVEISAHTEMRSSLFDNALTKQYSTNNLLIIALTPKKEYANLSINLTSKGLDFNSLQPTNYFDLPKERVFEFEISVKKDYKKGSKVDYWISIIDNNKLNSNTTKSFEYEVGKVDSFDSLKSNIWAIIMLIFIVIILALAYTLDKRRFGQLSEYLFKFIFMR